MRLREERKMATEVEHVWKEEEDKRMKILLAEALKTQHERSMEMFEKMEGKISCLQAAFSSGPEKQSWAEEVEASTSNTTDKGRERLRDASHKKAPRYCSWWSHMPEDGDPPGRADSSVI